MRSSTPSVMMCEHTCYRYHRGCLPSWISQRHWIRCRSVAVKPMAARGGTVTARSASMPEAVCLTEEMPKQHDGLVNLAEGPSNSVCGVLRCGYF